MWEQIFNMAVSNGIWAVLFLALLIYQLKDSRAREGKYQKTISSLSSSLNTVNSIYVAVKENTATLDNVENTVLQMQKVVNIKTHLEKKKNVAKKNDTLTAQFKEVENEN